MKHSESITAVAPAFVKALSQIGIVKKDSKNPFLKNKYASLDAIIEATKPILAKHDLSAFQIVNDDGIETIIMHTSGEWIGSDYMKIMPEVSKGLSQAQAVGVATTYTKRYQLGALLNISTEEDTDGQYADNKDLAPAKDNRPELTPLHEKWVGAVKSLATKETTIEKIAKHYRMSDATSAQLIKEAGEHEAV